MAFRASIPAPAPADLQALARRFRLPLADLSAATAQSAALIPERWARQFNVVAIAATERYLDVATADPLDLECERVLGFATGRRVRLALADRDAISRRIDE